MYVQNLPPTSLSILQQLLCSLQTHDPSFCSQVWGGSSDRGMTASIPLSLVTLDTSSSHGTQAHLGGGGGGTTLPLCLSLSSADPPEICSLLVPSVYPQSSTLHFPLVSPTLQRCPAPHCHATFVASLQPVKDEQLPQPSCLTPHPCSSHFIKCTKTSQFKYMFLYIH